MKRITILIITAVLLYSCRQPEPQLSPEITTPVRVAEIRQEKIIFPVRTSGIVAPASEIKLSFKTGGIVKTLYSDEGDRVKKGSLLAELDRTEIESQVVLARKGLEKAKRDFTRAENLYSDSVITLEQYQNAQTAYEVSAAMLEAADFNNRHSRIIAPAEGVILKRLVEAHEMVSPGYPVFIFGTTGTQWKIKAALSDRDYVRIITGDSAKITFDAYPGNEFRAVVSQITEAANAATGTYEIELVLEHVNIKLASGFVAKVAIYPSKTDTYYKIPIESVMEGEGRTGFVFAVDKAGTARKVKIDISGISEGWAVVSGNLEGNEVIATEGAAYLSDGDSVNIVK